MKEIVDHGPPLRFSPADMQAGEHLLSSLSAQMFPKPPNSWADLRNLQHLERASELRDADLVAHRLIHSPEPVVDALPKRRGTRVESVRGRGRAAVAVASASAAAVAGPRKAVAVHPHTALPPHQAAGGRPKHPVVAAAAAAGGKSLTAEDYSSANEIKWCVAGVTCLVPA